MRKAIPVAVIALAVLAGCNTTDPSTAPANRAAPTVAAPTEARSAGKTEVIAPPHGEPAPDEPLGQAKRAEKDHRYAEARTLFERWLAAHPEDGEATFDLGYAMFLQAGTQPPGAEPNALRLQAKELILKARKLGSKTAEIVRFDDAINADGSDRKTFSAKPEVEALMQRAERAYSKGQYEEALTDYQAALQLDPSLYAAALFIGDTYFAQKDYGKANRWLARAVEIDPNVETAYRYWADALMRQGRIDEARDRYIDAFVAEPYNRYTQSALNHFAEVSRHPLQHPPIKPWRAGIQVEGDKVTMTMPPDMDPIMLAYAAARAVWVKEERPKHFPANAAYRHSLPEEIEAMKKVAIIGRELAESSPQSFTPWKETIEAIERLDRAGLLEAYVLYEGADEGIARDYAEYRNRHRETLARYIREVWFGAK